MPWSERTRRYWTVCWKCCFIPYPCRKTKKVYCGIGVLRIRCYGFFGEKWFCCGGKQSHWWSFYWGIGNMISSGMRVCKDKIPSQIDKCPDTVGDAPPGRGYSQNYLTRAVVGGSTGLFLGGLISYLVTEEISTTAYWAVLSSVFLAGFLRGRCKGFLISLLAIIAFIILFILKVL